MSESWEPTLRQVLKDLVSEGQAPNGILPAQCGELEHVVQALYDAHAEGGAQKVRELWTTLSKADNRLAAFLAGDASAEGAIRLHWAREALLPQPPMDWVIEGVIGAGNVVVFVGEPGSKKTWLMLDAGVCVANGEPFLDKPTKQMTVLVIDEESGVRRLNYRLSTIMRAHNAGADTPLAYVCMSGLSLIEADAADRLAAYIEAARAGFVVIDALPDVMLGGDENAVRDVQRVFHNLRRAADRTGAAIAVIHHTSKAGNYRGSSAIKGAVDVMLMVESKPASPNIDIASEKSRDTEPFSLSATARFEAEMTVIASSLQAPQPARLSKAENHVLQFFQEYGNATIAQVQAHAGDCSANAARQAVYTLQGRGLVARKDGGGPGAKATYGLVQSSQTANLSEPV